MRSLSNLLSLPTLARVAAAVILAGSVGLVVGQAAAEWELIFGWSAPTTGSPVARYVGEWRLIAARGDTATFEAGPWLEPTGAIAWPPPQLGRVQLHVAGVDSLDRQGPWSEWSEAVEDLGPPGAPSAPALIGLRRR